VGLEENGEGTMDEEVLAMVGEERKLLEKIRERLRKSLDQVLAGEGVQKAVVVGECWVGGEGKGREKGSWVR
jgi:hypothetical protein